MPEMSGVEAIGAIRKDYPSSRFIVLTTYQGDQDIERALSAGAQGYLLKRDAGRRINKFDPERPCRTARPATTGIARFGGTARQLGPQRTRNGYSSTDRQRAK